MKVKLEQLVMSNHLALLRLCKENMPARLSFTLASVVRAITPHVEEYERARLATCQEHGKLNEDGSLFVFESQEIAQRVDAEIRELLDTEIELPGISKISLDGNSDTIQMTPEDAMALEWLFEVG